MYKFFFEKILKIFFFISFLLIFFALEVKAQDYQKNIRIKKFQNLGDMSEVVATSSDKNNNIVTLVNAKKLGKQFSYVIYSKETLRKIWALRLNKNENIEIIGQDLFIDDYENIYVLGEIWESISRNKQKFIAKYNSQGKKQWDQKLSNLDDSIKLQKILVKNNNIYVLGTILSDEINVVLYKFDDSGNFILNKKYTGLGAGKNNVNRTIVAKLDKDENIYIAGQTLLQLQDSTLLSPFILKVNSSEEMVFKELFSVHDCNLLLSSLDFDEQKNIYLVGSIISKSDELLSIYQNNENIKLKKFNLLSGTEDYFILKYNSKENKKVWIRISGDSNYHNKIHDIKIFENHIYVVGSSAEILKDTKVIENPNIFIKQFDLNGNKNWSNSLPYAGMVNGNKTKFNNLKLNVHNNDKLIIGGSVRTAVESELGIHYYGALIKIIHNKNATNHLHLIN